MVGRGLRIGLSEFGEGIARGIRYKMASKERGIWHLEGLRRKSEEDERQDDLRITRRDEEREYQEQMDDRSRGLRRIEGFKSAYDETGYNDPNYISNRKMLSSIGDSIAKGGNPFARIPEDILLSISAHRGEIATRKKTLFDLDVRYKGSKIDDEDGNYYTIYNDQTKGHDVLSEKERDSRLKELKRERILFPKDTERNKEIKATERMLFDAPIFGSREEAIRKLPTVNYTRAFSEASGGIDVFSDRSEGLRGEVPAGTGTTPAEVKPLPFKQQLAEADADMQRNYEDLSEKGKKIVKELVEMGDDLAIAMEGLSFPKGEVKQTKPWKSGRPKGIQFIERK